MRRSVALLALAAASAGCTDGLRFRQDQRLRFALPAERAEVRVPLEVKWRARDLPPGVVFGVFVDRHPMAPGEDVADLAADDPLCRPESRCPDRDWLARNRVHLTRRSRLVLRALPRGGVDGLGDRHEITVVLLDARGRRIGESAWTRTVFEPGGRP